MGKITGAFQRMFARGGSVSGTASKTHSVGKSTTVIAAVAVLLTVGASDGTAANWVRTATVGMPALTAGKLGVDAQGFDLNHEYSFTQLARTGWMTITNTGNVPAAFTLATVVDGALAPSVTLNTWAAPSSASCTADAATQGYAMLLPAMAGNQVLNLDAGTSTTMCIRTTLPRTALSSASGQTLNVTVNVSTSIAGTGWIKAFPTPFSISQSVPAWDAYATRVKADGAARYWPMSEASGDFYDWIGTDDATVGTVTRNADGIVAGSGSSTFPGTATGFAVTKVATAEATTNPVTVEAWIRTTTTQGGKIVGFGNMATASPLSDRYDRHLYMEPDGRVVFGVHNGAQKMVTSQAALNDGAWHHLVGTVSGGTDASGLRLYVDGILVSSDPSVSTAEDNSSGYWRIGGDSHWGAGSPYFAGDIDDVAVYQKVLTDTQVRDHWTASGRTLVTYDDRVLADGATNYWRLGGTSAAVYDSKTSTNTATAVSTVTHGVEGAIFTSLDGATGFDGTSTYLQTSTSYSNPQLFSIELWFKANPSTVGGILMGFGSGTNANPDRANHDRKLSMRDTGQLEWGIYSGGHLQLVTTGTYRDGNWHHVVVTQSSTAGATIYVDGKFVIDNANMRTPEVTTGSWLIGADNIWSGTTNKFFNGTLDEVAFYNGTVLDGTKVASHWTAAGRK
ncbi:MAG: hypothetical protein JWP66_105 [Naasia sp.]|nr:hypothetical protein [Naasia sp.]